MDFVITVPDAHVTRIRAAFGRSTVDNVRVPATAAEVRQVLLDFLRSRVQSYETEVAAKTKSDEVLKEVW